ncbi:MAG: TIGR00374 family protein [Dehalococcoidia bacterium]|nr:MAG: TIGR00374 family protein [Dehalococcoidia bacterium]
MIIRQPSMGPEAAPPLPLTETAPPEEASGDLSLRRRVFRLRTLISFLAAGAILWFLVTRLNVNLADLWAQLRQTNLGLFLLALFVYYLGFPLRALRWRLLLEQVEQSDHRARERAVHPSVARLSEILVLGWFANCVVPAKIGDFYRAYLLKDACGVSFARTTGTIVAERMIDLIVLFALLLLSAVGVIRGMTTDHALVTEHILLVGLVLVGLLVLVLVGLRLFGRRLEGVLPARLGGFWYRFQHGIVGSFQLRQFPLVAVLTIAVWLTEAGRLYFVSQSLGVPLGLAVIVFVALANSLLTAVPATPGGLGVVEAGVITLFALIGVSDDAAAAVTLLDRTISYWSLIAVGLVAYLFAFRHRRA